MNAKELSLKRSAAGKRRRALTLIVGSIGVGLVALGLSIGLLEDGQSFWAFLFAGFALTAMAVFGYRPRRIDAIKGRRHRRHQHRSHPPEE